MSMEPSTETQAGTGAEPKIPPSGEGRAQVFGELRSYRRTIAPSVARACGLAISVTREDFFRLQVDLYDGRALFRSDSTDRGGYEEALAADVQGDITFAVNAVYLRQIARSVGGRMILRLSGPTRPMRIEPVDGDPVVFVAVPLRAEHSIPRPV